LLQWMSKTLKRHYSQRECRPKTFSGEGIVGLTSNEQAHLDNGQVLWYKHPP
jgi:hypothetical protein